MKMSSFFTNRTSTAKKRKQCRTNILKNQNPHQNLKNVRAVREVRADGEIRAVREVRADGKIRALREMRAECAFRPQSLEQFSNDCRK